MTSVLEQIPGVASSDATAPRVLQCLSDLSPGRMTRRAIMTTRGIVEGGGISVVASAGGRFETHMHRAGAQLLPFQPQRAMVFQNRVNLDVLETVASQGIKLVHLHGVAEAQGVKALADAASLPVVQTLHDVADAGGFFQRRATRRHLVGDVLVAVSRYVADCVARDFRGMGERVHVVPPGFDLDALSDQEVSAPRTIALAEKWGLIEDPSAVILVPDACTDTRWLQSMAQAMTAREDVVWVLIGEEDSTPPPSLPERVIWVPGTDDLAAAMKLASVVVCAPDLPVAACDSALEAQAMGRPVIVSDAGAGAESLDAGRSGWLVPAGDGTALAQAVGEALGLDPSQRAHMGLAGRAFVQGHFSHERTHAALMGVYDQVLRCA
ncbi:MAG: glycosyltransferase family 4 protein [Pseudomonadota bacterium]